MDACLPGCGPLRGRRFLEHCSTPHVVGRGEIESRARPFNLLQHGIPSREVSWRMRDGRVPGANSFTVTVTH